MKISVVTTVYNDAMGLERMLASLEGQEHLHEVVVVDADSSDGSFEVAKEATARLPVKVLQKAGPRGTGFQTACDAARGDVLAFIGADDYARPGWTGAIARAFQDGADVVVGHNEIEGQSSRGERVPWVVNGQDISHAGCNTSYRASLYHEVGGIDPAFITAEDMELNLRAVRAGARIVHVPEARVVRSVRAGRRDTLRQAYWNGFGRGQLLSKHGDVPGMKSGAIRAALRPWLWPRLLAGFKGFIDARKSS